MINNTNPDFSVTVSTDIETILCNSTTLQDKDKLPPIDRIKITLMRGDTVADCFSCSTKAKSPLTKQLVAVVGACYKKRKQSAKCK